VIDFVIVIY